METKFTMSGMPTRRLDDAPEAVDRGTRGTVDHCKPVLLAVTSEMPWPLNSGGHLRSYYLLRALADRFALRLIVPTPFPQSEAVEALMRIGVSPRAVCVGHRTTWREATRATMAAAHGEPYVFYRRHRWRAVRDRFRQELRTLNPMAVYFDHIDSLVYAELVKDLPIVLDMHNVYSALARRESRAHGRLGIRYYLAREAQLLARAERRAAQIAEALMAVSPEDASYFRSLGARNVQLVPNGVDAGKYASLRAGRRQGPPMLLYLGAMSWNPNADAARFLAEQVLPEVRAAFPDAQLQIVGKNPPRQVQDLTRRPGVHVLGEVDEVTSYLARAHVMAVPLESGGGTRLKILEAFAAGLPVVSTPVGCEGLSVRHLEHLWISQRPAFAQGVLRLLRESQLANELARSARLVAQQQYDWNVVGQKACRAVEAVMPYHDAMPSTGELMPAGAR